MKKIFLAAIFLLAFSIGFAQKREEESSKGFKKENLFTGGDLTLSFYNGGTVLGVNPCLGYSINKYIDIAVSANFNYTSQRDYYVYGDKIRQTVYGPGAFARVYPVDFLFGQVAYEHNFSRVKYISVPGSGYSDYTGTVDANSLLLGAGYCIGREAPGSTFFYFSIMWDVSGNANSPYVDGLGRSFPIGKAGIQIPLFQPKSYSHHHNRRD